MSKTNEPIDVVMVTKTDYLARLAIAGPTADDAYGMGVNDRRYGLDRRDALPPSLLASYDKGYEQG